MFASCPKVWSLETCQCLWFFHFGVIKKRKPPWEYYFLETCYSPEPCVQVEAESERACGEIELGRGVLHLSKPRANAGVTIQISQGEGSPGGICFWGSHLFIYLFIEHLLYTRHCFSPCEIRIARCLLSWNLLSCGKILQMKH